jgi:hypothetical protein
LNAAKNLFEVFSDVVGRLEGAGIPYMVVGSVASIIYGEPRMTKDMDLVVDLLPSDAIRIESLFPFEGFYVPHPEILRQEIAERGQFNLVHHDSGLKIDLVVRRESDFAKTEFSRRRRIPFWEGFEAFVATPEDVIIKKLDFYREGKSAKHLQDIRGILAQTEVDEGYVESWAGKLGLIDLWCQARGGTGAQS